MIATKERQLVFDFEFRSTTENSESYREGTQDLLRRIVPSRFFEEHDENFEDHLPLIKASDLSKAPCTFSVIMLCKHRANATNFFYDMIGRWILPNSKMNVELFFTSDVRLPNLSDELYTVAEIVVHLKSAKEVDEVKKNFEVIEKELRLGLVSSYHARRILEFKGLSSDGKTALIQEKIGSLIQSHSSDFDRGIFSEMQQFLVNSDEEFKNKRDHHHISRMISNLYSLKKVIKQKFASMPLKRHIQIKYLKTQLPTRRRFMSPFDTRGVSGEVGAVFCPIQDQHVLGILVGMNFLHSHEVFETSHLTIAIQKMFPHLVPVEGSCFIDRTSNPLIQTLYLEVKKLDWTEFSLDEVQSLRKELPERILASIEQLAHPIFMPRNEEEVLRNIMLLSGQLRFAKDLPQVVISFDKQQGGDLYFTVILACIRSIESPSIQEIFLKNFLLPFLPDRTHRVGNVRKKNTKEACVFSTYLNSKKFLLVDHSIDMYKARQYVFEELTRVLGKVRDFNGGMIYKQSELLDQLKSSLAQVAFQHSVLLEMFYYSIDPVEMRTSLDADHLKQWFLLFLQMVKGKRNDFLFKQDDSSVFAIVPVNALQKKILQQGINDLAIPSHLLAMFTIEVERVQYYGLLLLTDDKDLQGRFLSVLG